MAILPYDARKETIAAQIIAAIATIASSVRAPNRQRIAAFESTDIMNIP
jgi:hypothetical protein